MSGWVAGLAINMPILENRVRCKRTGLVITLRIMTGAKIVGIGLMSFFSMVSFSRAFSYHLHSSIPNLKTYLMTYRLSENDIANVDNQ